MNTLSGNMLRELRRCKVEFDRDGVIGSAWASHAHKLRLKLLEMGFLAKSDYYGTFFLAIMTEKGHNALKKRTSSGLTNRN